MSRVRARKGKFKFSSRNKDKGKFSIQYWKRARGAGAQETLQVTHNAGWMFK